jgi:glycosyltransferase involved in cell wall biosynthesis
MKRKIAILGPSVWAIGSINFFLKKYLSKYYDVCVFDWDNSFEIKHSVSGLFDAVISTNIIVGLKNMGYKIDNKSKIIGLFHNDVSDLTKNNHFDFDVSNSLDECFFYGVSNKVCKSVKERYSIECPMLPIGVCSDFWKKRNINSIKTLGINYDVSCFNKQNYEDVKRMSYFLDICKESKIDYSVLGGKGFMRGNEIYDSCDMLVCTSTTEANPMGFLESAAQKIPFISTNVGIVDEFDSSMIFSSIKEASNIIDMFRDNQSLIKIHTDNVYDEVMDRLSWEKVIDNYWYPEIEKAIG